MSGSVFGQRVVVLGCLMLLSMTGCYFEDWSEDETDWNWGGSGGSGWEGTCDTSWDCAPGCVCDDGYCISEVE
ncbi:MAG: hypothetical protein KC561_21720, partial [Myxococcales bacterium]|nr:hypothetical protein [Myxococcales bacterium]